MVVASSYQLTSNMQRVVFTGEQFVGFPEGQGSGYIKLLLPNATGSIEQRTTIRTYTIRRFDSHANELTVDFSLHDHTCGPASNWANNANPDDHLTINRPGPIKLVNNDANWFFLVGVMTALPALACNLEQLPDDAVGYAVIEVTSDQDEQSLKSPKGIDIHWVVNARSHVHNPAFVDTVKSLQWSDGVSSIWTACESHCMRTLRTYFKVDRHVAKEDIYISSYWKIDRTEEQHKQDKALDQKQADTEER